MCPGSMLYSGSMETEMKDAQGHGSNGKGSHSAMIDNLPAKMQRRHFEAIASELRGQADAGSPEHLQRVNAVADKLSTTNPGFRRDFFMAAAVPGAGSYNNKSTGRTSGMKGVRKAIAKMRG